MGEAIAKWGLSFLVVLLLVLVVALSWRFCMVWLFGQSARATVVGFKMNRDGKSKTPIARFTSETGESFEILGKLLSEAPALKAGDSTWVFYDRKSPLQGFIKGEPHFTLPLILLGMLSFILFIWIGAMSIGDTPGLGDPLGLLQRLVSMFEPSQRIRFFSFVMVTIGTLIATSTFVVISKMVYKLKTEGLYAQARVMGIKNSSYTKTTDHARSYESRLLIEFRDQAQNTVQFKAGWSSWLSPLRVGDEVGVYYLKEDPQRALVDTWYELYSGIFFSLLLSLAFWFVFLVHVFKPSLLGV